MKRRASAIFINSISAYVRMIVGMLLSLLITRTSLDVLAENTSTAKEVFGVFMLLTSISTMSQFLNDSTQKSVVRFLAVSMHDGDHQQTKRFFNSGWAMSTVLGVLQGGILALLAPWLVTTFNISEELVSQATYVVWLSCLSQIIIATTQSWGAELAAEDRYTLINILNVTQQFLVWVGLNFIGFLPVEPLVGLAIVWLSPSALVGMSLAGWTMLRKPAFRIDFQYVRWVEFRQLFALGGWSSVSSFASNLYERTDQILINLFLGAAFNSFYGVAIQLGNSIGRLVSALTGVLLPTASRIVSDGSVWEKQQLMLRSTRYVLAIALPFLAGMTIFRREIIELWLGKSFSPTVAILPLTMCLVFCRMPILITKPYLTAANRLKLPALAILLDGVCNVFLSILYVREFNLGLSGIVLGTLTTNLIRFTLFEIPYISSLIELPVSKYWSSCYGKPMINMLWLVPALVLLHWLNFSGIITVSLLVIAGLLYSLGVWLLVFDEYERKLFTGMLTSLILLKKSSKKHKSLR